MSDWLQIAGIAISIFCLIMTANEVLGKKRTDNGICWALMGLIISNIVT